MRMSGYIEGKNKNQILKELVGTAQPGSPVQEQQKMGIIVRCTEDIEESLKSLEDSMNQNAESSENLSKKIFWLNIVIAIATLIGTLFGIYKVIYDMTK